MLPAEHSKAPVVIVDDDPNDLFLLCDRLRRAGVANPLKTFGRADEAMAFLKQEASRGPGARPACLLCTDLKMPGYSGLELAAWVRAHEQLRDLPIAIISGGEDAKDRAKAAKLGAAYHLKFPRRETLAALILQNGGPRRS